MAKINILPSKVYNRIAAGEVVDRPSSVVKELVENSIDAGATEIQIYVENGGKDLIRVVDNGCGIEREDLQSAYLPHATSKIAKADDLENILTLGFRGEAIASISAVSKMTITSKVEGGNCYRLTCDGGELGQIVETTGEKGTDVEVKYLFYHTPVRLGFLKSDKVEETEITNLVSRFILNRADVAFTYYLNGKKALQSFGGGEEEAMACVYGAATLAECYQINAVKHGVRLRGYIGNPNFYKANKSFQSVFLNGRYITNTTISAAVSNAYSSYLMKRQYPFYVLHIDMPTEIVDVNVHPNKADVRFADNQIVYGCIYSVISSVLDGQSKAVEYVVKMPQKGVYTDEGITPTPSQKNQPKEMSLADLAFSYEDAKEEVKKNTPLFASKEGGENLAKEEEEAPITNPVYVEKPVRTYADKEAEHLAKIRKLQEKYPGLYYEESSFYLGGEKEQAPLQEALPNPTQNAVQELPFEEERVEKEVRVNAPDWFAENKKYLDIVEGKFGQVEIEVEDFSYAGKLFNTYLLYQHKDDVYIIDQHAAHERLIFDRLKEQIENRSVVRQPTFVPFVMELSPFETTFIRDHSKLLDEIGFTISEPKERHFEISAVPADLQRIDLKSFMHSLLGEMNGYRAIRLEHLLRDKLASAACKAAVKGGMDLTREEIDKLLILMDGNMGLRCPHGRPLVVKMSKTQIEKMFKRIV